MSSWVYLFSNFTSEALLLEGLVILVLISSYTAYWILQKRRHGVVEKTVPASVVQNYLNALMNDTLQLRTQLFGLLSQAGIEPPQGTQVTAAISPGATAQPAAKAAPATETVTDPNLQGKIGELEEKISSQAEAMKSLEEQKAKIEKELLQAKKAKGDSGEGDAAASKELQKKIDELEARLAEYSVIEDDLANLKRLQQENAKLKEALGSKADEIVEAAEAEAKEEEEKEKAAEAKAEEEAPQEEPEEEEAPAEEVMEAKETSEETEPQEESEEPAEEEPAEETAEEPMEAASEPEEEASEEGAQAAEATEGDPQFDNLVDQVEESISEPAQEAKADAASSDEEKSDDDDDDTPGAGAPKADDDLLSEFEKMLNS